MRSLTLLALVLLPLLVALGTPEHVLVREQSLAAAIFVSVLLLWVSELIPLAATALLVPVLISAYGLQTIDIALQPFGSSVLYLFLGAFLLSAALHKQGLDKRIAYFLLCLPKVATSLTRLSFAIFLTAFVLSMWVSNTATAVMMCPIVLGIAAALRAELDAEQLTKARKFLLLGIAYSCSIGGIATPVGSPPNMIALGFLESRNLTIGFLTWMSFALPLALVCFTATFFVLAKLYSIKEIVVDDIERLQTRLHREAQDLGALSRAEFYLILVFGVTVLLWLLPGILQSIAPNAPYSQWIDSHLPMTTVALAAGLSLFVLPADRERHPLITWADASQIDWGTIILFGGGLSLGALLDSSGLSQTIAGALLSGIQDNTTLLIIVATAVGIALTSVASNTASVTVLIAILFGILPATGSIAVFAPVLAVTFAGSCSFMLPVATPPNAIVYGTGLVTMRDLMKAGLWLNIICWIFISIAMSMLMQWS